MRYVPAVVTPRAFHDRLGDHLITPPSAYATVGVTLLTTAVPAWFRTRITSVDPATDTVVSIVKNPAGFGGVGGIGDSQLFNICPLTGKLLTLQSGVYVMEWDSITQPETSNLIARWDNGVYLSDTRTFLMHQTTTPTDRLVGAYQTANSTYLGAFFEMTRGNFYTYAELPVPITKTNTQSLRVSYTLSFA